MIGCREGAELSAVWVWPACYFTGITGYHLAPSVRGGVVPNRVCIPLYTAGEDVFQSRKRD